MKPRETGPRAFQQPARATKVAATTPKTAGGRQAQPAPMVGQVSRPTATGLVQLESAQTDFVLSLPRCAAFNRRALPSQSVYREWESPGYEPTCPLPRAHTQACFGPYQAIQR